MVLGMNVLACEHLPFPQSLPKIRRIPSNDTATAGLFQIRPLE
jgi:hypothetical protein